VNEGLEDVRARLAAPDLDTAGLFACAARLAELAHAAEAAGRPVRRIALAGDLTLDFLQRAIACALALEGELATFYVAPFGALRTECLDTASGLHAFRPDCVVLVPDGRNVGAEDAGAIPALWDALAPLGCAIVQHTLVPPQRHWRGAAERWNEDGPREQVLAVDAALRRAGRGRVTWLEADRLAAEIGLGAWAPERFHLAGRLPFDPRFLPRYLPWFRAAWRSAVGREKKVLVLDLDGTLWGGVIGDDGVQGLALGPAAGAPGEAFAGWQAYLAELAQRGVVLAVCSRNAPDVAAAGFTHEASRLRRDDFAAFVCSWDDKAAGLRRVAREIGVGLDTLVFADDNPAECALVRRLLPQVEVVELGSDPAAFIARLDAGHWFDTQTITSEDRARRQSYAGRAEARALATSATDLAGYLRSLEMTGSVTAAQAQDLPRLAQLEQKTNQFNLTTRRTSQAELARWLADPERIVLTLRLADRFADHGLVGSLVAVREDDALRIVSWLLSCRVFARTAEQAMLAGLCARGRALGVRALVGEYRPTGRNGVVADLYARLGFAPAGGDGAQWRLVLRDPADDPETFVRLQSA
jgi:FkbH-like protein